MFGSGDEVKVGTKADNDPDHVYLICECGTNLRFPADMGILEYTCPKCGHKDKAFTGAKKQ